MTTNNMKEFRLLLLGLLLSGWCCSTSWAQNSQTEITSEGGDPPPATLNKKDPPPGETPSPSDLTTFSAVNNNITTILQDYQELTGKTVIEDSNLSANAVPITIMAPNPMPREQLVRLIEAALLLNNYAFVPGPSDNTVKVINLNTGKNPRSEGIRLFTTPDSLPEGEQIVSYYMPLSYISATEALAVFQTHVLPRAYTAFVPVNSAQAVVITENTSVIKELIALKQLIDIPPAATSTEFVQLIRADAEKVTDMLNKLLENQQKGTGSGQTPNAPGNVQVNYGVGGSGIGGLQAQLVADARTNRILIVTRPQNMPQLRTLIQSFDLPNLAEKPLEYRLRYVPAGDVLNVLKDVLSEESQQAGQGGTSGTSGGTQGQQQQPSQQRNSSFTSNSSGGTGAGTGSSSYAGGYSQSSATGGGGNSGGQDLLQEPNEELGPQAIVVGKTRVISDAKDNKIIVIGPPESIAKVRMLLDRLDQRPQQVYLSTVIGNLQLNGETDVGVDWAQTFKKISGGSGVASSNLNTNINGSSTIGSGSGGTVVVDPAQILSTAMIPGFQGLALYGKIGDAVSVFVRALDTRSHFTVLARPAVYTANNKRAVISNGQQVPIPGTSLSNVPTTGTGSTTTGSVASVESTVQYENVELRLEVIPLINSNNEVTLKIAQINDTLGNNVNISGNLVPIINSQRLTTTVTIPSGATVVLGGLIQDSINKTDNGVPYVDNIPYLGRLFKYTTNIKNRTELLIFIQPTIVNNSADAYRASLKEEKRSNVGSEMSDLAHPPDYAQPGPTGKRLKNQK
ncbi:MAG TPA: secretin N-terminal domain-containing protein [Chthoniobacterales bacterium]|nr:secretin N-terminal domain-containing protein [Chthoniobacterales bacterium]